MLKQQKGFTLIELVMIIVILGILAAVAIPRYIDLTTDAAEANARGVLGTLRSANAITFANRLIKGTTATYTMGVIAGAADLQGVQNTFGTNTILLTISGNNYTFTLSPIPAAPTTVGTIAAATATW